MTEQASQRSPTVPAAKPKGEHLTVRQVCIDINSLMAAKMTEAARKAGMPMPRYAAVLLEAAWAARSGKALGDIQLDAWVGACLAMYGSARAPAQIAEVLGVSVRVVNKIIDAWRRVLREQADERA